MAKLVVIPDAELLLPDDKLPEGRGYQPYSTWLAGTYPSLQAIIRKREAIEGRLNAEMLDWQREVEPPCYVQYGVRDPNSDARILVYGKVMGIDEFINSEKGAGARVLNGDRERFARRLRRRMESANKRGWLYGEWFSTQQPLGQWASVHKAVLQRVLTEAEYKELEARAWEDQ